MRLPILFAAAFMVATPALAHPKLLSASPAPDAKVGAPARVQMTFSEGLVAKFSGADVVMTAMPGMAGHGPMKVPGEAKVAGDGKTLVVAFKRPLPKGSYRVDWHVVSVDTHRVTGSYSFTVA